MLASAPSFLPCTLPRPQSSVPPRIFRFHNHPLDRRSPTCAAYFAPLTSQVICPSDEELCRLHGEQLEELAAFKQQYLGSPEWRAFCERHAVAQAQPDGPSA